MSPFICYFYVKKDGPYYFTRKNELQYCHLYLVHKPLRATNESDFAIKYVSGSLPFRRAVSDRCTKFL